MAYDPLKAMPREWKTDVTIEQSGGKDDWNNPRPAKHYVWPQCLIAPRSTMDPLDFSDLVENRVVLYGRKPPVMPTSTDVIIIPEGRPMAGRWVVRGRPSQWHVGWEIVMDRENASTDRPSRTS